MNSDPGNQIFQRAYARAERIPEFVASSIRIWKKAFNDSPTHALGADEQAVLNLGLCTRPRRERWIDDVNEIAAAVGIDSQRLVSFLRAADAIERFGDVPHAEGREDGRLMAARDRDEEGRD
jgi:hypothetical protein